MTTPQVPEKDKYPFGIRRAKKVASEMFCQFRALFYLWNSIFLHDERGLFVKRKSWVEQFKIHEPSEPFLNDLAGHQFFESNIH